MGWNKLLATALDKKSKTITLNEEHLAKKPQAELKFNSLRPSDVLLRHFHSNVKVTLSEKSLTRTGAKVVFNYKNKNYLIVYNK